MITRSAVAFTALSLVLLAAVVRADYGANDALKPPCRGLMSRDVPAPPGMPFLDNVCVQVAWRDLESADGVFDGKGWDKIETARKANLKIRLRIFAGVHTPDFIKRLGGPALSDPDHGTDASKTGGIAMWNRHDNRGGTVPYWWTPQFLDRYECLMREVAKRYEDVPEIREVVDSACMTLYAEPFYRAHADAPTNERLFRAGLTFEKDRAAHERALRIHNDLFKHTRTSLAINAWDVIDDSPSHLTISFKPTYEFVTWARAFMGEKLVLQNNGMGVEAACRPGQSAQTNHFCFLSQAAGPKGFQTRTLARLGGTADDLFKTLDVALKFGANFVELPNGFRRFDKATLRDYDQKLEHTPM